MIVDAVINYDFNPRHPYGWRLLLNPAPIPHRNFNPRHPYGWRLGATRKTYFVNAISIHATHTGGDRT